MIQNSPTTTSMFFDLKLFSHFFNESSSGKLIPRAKKMIAESEITEISISEG